MDILTGQMAAAIHGNRLGCGDAGHPPWGTEHRRAQIMRGRAARLRAVITRIMDVSILTASIHDTPENRIVFSISGVRG